MTIYIEYFLIQNILINFCLLRLVFLTTKNSTTFFKLIITSIVGSIFSVISAVFLTNQVIINLLKVVCSLIMILIPFKQTRKQFMFNYILLFLYTFAFSGAITSLSSNMFLTSFGAIISSKFNLETITLFIIVLTYIFEQISTHLKHNFKSNKYMFESSLYLKNKQVKINAFLDTGNLLEHNGKPVIILDFNTYLNLTNNDLKRFFTASTINTNTINGTNSLKLFEIDKVEITQGKNKKEIIKPLIAVSTNKFSNNKYQALLSPLLF